MWKEFAHHIQVNFRSGKDSF